VLLHLARKIVQAICDWERPARADVQILFHRRRLREFLQQIRKVSCRLVQKSSRLKNSGCSLSSAAERRSRSRTTCSRSCAFMRFPRFSNLSRKILRSLSRAQNADRPEFRVHLRPNARFYCGILGRAMGIEIACLTCKSFKANGVAPPPHSNWSLLEPNLTRVEPRLFEFVNPNCGL
jgi:hypothetical protein